MPERPRTLLICHVESELHADGLARWLASFSDLVGVVLIRERSRRWRRIRNEAKRSGWLRLLDVAAFRAFHWLFLRPAAANVEAGTLALLRDTYPALRGDLPRLEVANPNSAAARGFIASLAPDLTLARCKFLLRERVFAIPPLGTFVMHPGVCPEYRNSHGCFWALAQDDLERVGMTLLKIDKGVDTGPVYGYFSYPFDELRESHTIIEHRVVFENLPQVADRLLAVAAGTAEPIDTTGRRSGVWGQPWLSAHLRWKAKARHRAALAAGAGS